MYMSTDTVLNGNAYFNASGGLHWMFVLFEARPHVNRKAQFETVLVGSDCIKRRVISLLVVRLLTSEDGPRSMELARCSWS
jgi:hypothetical protein